MEKLELEKKKHKKPNWREWISYSQHLPKWVADLLDEIAEFIPEPKTEDRYSKMSEFLEEAESKGLIRSDEHRKLRYELAQQI